VPLAIQSFVANTTDPAALILEVQQGTALLRRPTSPDFAGITERTTDVPEGSIIRVDPSAQAILTVRDPSGLTDLVIVQLYANTEVTLEAAQSPRFDDSPNPHRFNLLVNGGRVRVNVLDDTDRTVAARVEAPQGEVTFTTGTYALEVTNEELQVTVREGQASVHAQGESVVVEPSQRGQVTLGQSPQGGLSGERNLIANGSFADAANPAWSIEHDLQVPSESPGTIDFTTLAGRRAALFDRNGPSHAETRLVQRIDRDVTEAASLTLHFAVLVARQDVPVCGALGSECPLIVKINYRDTSGVEREWVQGFYLVSAPDPQNVNPRFCVTCSTRNPHRPIASNLWYPFDSGNLMELLAVDGITPARIQRITFYASGHSYRSGITDVELLVQD